MDSEIKQMCQHKITTVMLRQGHEALSVWLDITPRLTFCETLRKFPRFVQTFPATLSVLRAMEGLMAELSEDEKQSLDDALSTLDDLYEATLKPDGGFRSEQMAAIAKLAEEAMGCVLSVLDPEMYDAVQRDCPEKKLGREARAVRTLTLLDETPQKLAGLGAAFDTADLLRRRLGLDEPVAVPLLLASNRDVLRDAALAGEARCVLLLHFLSRIEK